MENKAKEKAIELVMRFFNEVDLGNATAKQCAIICVEEVIKTFDVTMPQSFDFWQQVLTELKQM